MTIPKLHDGDTLNVRASELDGLLYGGASLNQVIHYGAYFALKVISLDKNYDNATVSVREIKGLSDIEEDPEDYRYD